jgi:rod shape-determining protein MreD
LEKESRGLTLKILGCLIAAAFLQTTLVHQFPESLGQWLGHIDWFLLMTVYIGLQRDPIRALFTGAAAGLVQDIFSGGRAIGVNGFAYVLAAYITHRIAAFIVVDNMFVRFLTVIAASVVSTGVRLAFYALLKVELPVLAGGRTVAAILVFGIFANLIASILFYMPLDRFLSRDGSLRMRRSEARRRRI